LRERDARWQPRVGLEGPFFYANGRVLYYDPKGGQYWDPLTDFYVTNEEMDYLHSLTLEILSK
jgi:hypothetical protein